MVGLLSDQGAARVPIVGVRRSLSEFVTVNIDVSARKEGLDYAAKHCEMPEGGMSYLRECPVTLRRADVALCGSLSNWAELREALLRSFPWASLHLLPRGRRQRVQSNLPLLGPYSP